MVYRKISYGEWTRQIDNIHRTKQGDVWVQVLIRTAATVSR